MSRSHGHRARRVCPRRRREQGFTLVELLVSLALVVVLSGFIVGGLWTSTRAFEADRNSGLDVEANSAIESLRDFIGSALPTASPRGPGIAFEGRQEGLRFVALSEGRTLQGGPQEARIRRIGSDLVIEILGPPQSGQDRKAPVTSVVALRGVSELKFGYFGDAGGKGEFAWRNEWAGAGSLPSMVSIGIAFTDPRRNGPVVMVALRHQGPAEIPAALLPVKN